MDYQRFIEQLPTLYENWNQDSVRPKSQQFQQVLGQVQGMTTANIMQLLNFAVACMETDEIYCEIGSFQGTTLIGALLDRPETMAYAVDNFSEFDFDGSNREQLQKNLQRFNLESQVCFCDRDFEEFFWELPDIETENKIGVYLYDGAHDYRSQLLGLLLIRPFLANKALLIVDDANSKEVQQANWDFIATNPECQLLLEIFTPGNGYPTFWNGLQILSWDVEKSHNYSASTFREKRQERVIKALYNFSALEGSLKSLYQEALYWHQQKEFVLADKRYREFLLWEGDDAKAWLNLGILCYEAGDYEAAIDSIGKSHALDKANGYVYYYLGLVLEETNQRERAIAAYQKAIELNSNLTNAQKKLEQLLMQ